MLTVDRRPTETSTFKGRHQQPFDTFSIALQYKGDLIDNGRQIAVFPSKVRSSTVRCQLQHEYQMDRQ